MLEIIVQYQPQLFIAAGQTSGTISFDAINDLAVEGNETIILEIDNIANASLSSTQSVFNLTIIDDEIALITTDGSRHIHQASKSILLTPVMSTPITLSAGTVFIAEIVACPN